MIKVAADKYLFNIADFLPEKEIDLVLYDPEQPPQQLPRDIQALLIRSVTKINPQTLPAIPSALEFVATGSAGTDHVDIPYLKNHGVTFANAAGCNARSVAEYVATALLLWSDEYKIDLKDRTLGIVGVGHVGRAVHQQIQALGMETVRYDPPRQQRESAFQSASREEVLQSDILTLHTPLTRKGSHPTYHWLDADILQNHPFKLVLNTARGGVVDEQALLEAYKEGTVENFILDVWENEPLFNDRIAQQALIKTPHIAGYSIQAKTNASAMISSALLQHFGLPAPARSGNAQPGMTASSCTSSSLSTILSQLHPIKRYEQKFTALTGASETEKKAVFSHIRNSFPLRNEYHALGLSPELIARFPVLRALGGIKTG